MQALHLASMTAMQRNAAQEKELLQGALDRASTERNSYKQKTQV
jgi:hypothetical protein